jgi:hypothetical protein
VTRITRPPAEETIISERERHMDNDGCLLPLELAIDEMADDELDAVSGGLGLTYQQVKFEYTKQKED